MLKKILQKIKIWYLEKFEDTTREEYGTHVIDDDMSKIAIDLKIKFIQRLKFLITGKYQYRLHGREVFFIKNYKL